MLERLNGAARDVSRRKHPAPFARLGQTPEARANGGEEPQQYEHAHDQALEHALVPLMFSLVDSSDRLSSSAIARAAEAPTRRTSYYRSPFGVADAVCLAAVATALAACGGVVRGGWFG